VKTVQGDGWPAVRAAVFERDGGCLATSFQVFGSDVASDLCRNRYGDTVRYDDLKWMEWDHVREGVAEARINDEAHGVTVCAWHHRGSGWRIDTKAHRAKVRGWLAKHYPEVWTHATP
jgi:hypothetical protein